MLRDLFKLIGNYPIDNPHEGREAELMLFGNKPIALLGQWGLPGEPFVKACDLIQRRQESENAQIQCLDRAVDEGKITKKKIIAPPPTRMSAHVSLIAHFYCQNDKVNEMDIFIKFFKDLWYDLEFKLEMPKEVGLSFGYTQEDVDFWENGGYDSLGAARRFILENSKEFRRFCRATAMINSGNSPQFK